MNDKAIKAIAHTIEELKGEMKFWNDMAEKAHQDGQSLMWSAYSHKSETYEQALDILNSNLDWYGIEIGN